MKTCEYAGEPLRCPRSHPWSGVEGDPRARYYDFTVEPGLIRSVLEDFTPFGHFLAIQQFFALLERVNHAKSPLASSDCAFNGPAPSEQGSTGLECSGRLVLLYRELELNRREGSLGWLRRALHLELASLDPTFDAGIIGTTLLAVRYSQLPPGACLGEQLMLSFWAFGQDEQAVMQNLSRLLTALTRALRSVVARIPRSG